MRLSVSGSPPLAGKTLPEDGGEIIIEALRSQLAGALARFKQAKQVFVLSELPRATMGKVQKKVLRERFSGQI